MSKAYYKTTKLRKECDIYLRHLTDEIVKKVSRATQLSKKDIEEILAGTSKFLLPNTDKYAYLKGCLPKQLDIIQKGKTIEIKNSDPHDNFSLLLEKHRIVLNLGETVKGESDDINCFVETLNTKNPNGTVQPISDERTNLDILNMHRDSAAIRFLKNIGHILTVGIIGKLTKHSFKFWKSNGEVFGSRALEIATKEKDIDVEKIAQELVNEGNRP